MNCREKKSPDSDMNLVMNYLGMKSLDSVDEV